MDPQIQLCCYTCWLYRGQHGNWDFSIHILADYVSTNIGEGSNPWLCMPQHRAVNHLATSARLWGGSWSTSSVGNCLDYILSKVVPLQSKQIDWSSWNALFQTHSFCMNVYVHGRTLKWHPFVGYSIFLVINVYLMCYRDMNSPRFRPPKASRILIKFLTLCRIIKLYYLYETENMTLLISYGYILQRLDAWT